MKLVWLACLLLMIGLRGMGQSAGMGQTSGMTQSTGIAQSTGMGQTAGMGEPTGTAQPGKPDEEGFISIFDGKTLDHWKGDSTYWRVEDGCLVGVVTPATLLKRNTFIIYQGEMPENFEIKVEYKVSALGNSGINYRSEMIEGLPYALRGYQADLNGPNDYTGSNYEERRRTTLASRGLRVVLPSIPDADSLKEHIKDNQWLPKIVTDTLGDPAQLKAVIKVDDWNEYHIVVRGNRMLHYVNGVLMSDVTDNDTVNRRFTGWMGVQVHVGPPMRIAYRNFRVKKLADEVAQARGNAAGVQARGNAAGAQAPGNAEIEIGNHPARYDAQGMLLPWLPWQDAVYREMQWYLHCPVTHGYPNFVWMTFMDGNYQPDGRRGDFIPATQNGMGIISYLKYYIYDKRRNPKVLEWAKYMGDYLINESNTPDTGCYPHFTRSTGVAGKFPQPPDCGTQGDRPYEIEPDKGGIAGYALVLLYQETKERKYLTQAMRNAKALVMNMGRGDSTRSPWPFRVDYRTGEARGLVSGDMVYILRLFKALAEMGYSEPVHELWNWIVQYQLPDLEKGGRLWEQFFEDHDEANDRTAWAPLNLARYLLEKREALDTAWQLHAHELIEFVNRNFTGINHGIAVCGEQDHDKDPWGGILSTYGAVLMMYTAATGSNEYRGLGMQALDFATYALNTDGCPCERAGFSPCRGGWQEDSHTDKIHNFIDALEAGTAR